MLSNVSLSISSTWRVASAARVVGDRVVHQRGERTERLDRRPHRARDLVLDARCRPGCSSARPPAAVTAASTSRPLSSDRPVNATAAPSRREHLDDPGADPACPPGDQRHLAVKSHC